MKPTSIVPHPAFTLNGMEFRSTVELIEFAKELESQGDEQETAVGKFIQKWLGENEGIRIKTSGSTGKPKKSTFLKQNMANSAKATGAYFKTGPGATALLCLPAGYIAGKMMLVRAMVLGWDLHVVMPDKKPLAQYDNFYDFVAMVPYQVFYSLAGLKKVKKLIVGGGPVSKELETKLQSVPTEVFATYGMTETLSHIAVRRLNGPARTEVFSALPGVSFSLGPRGCLIIDAPEIAEDIIATNDLVELVSPSSFLWLGRYDYVINSGGIKINPEKTEEKLASFIDFPFIIAPEKDEVLGERVILILESKEGVEIPNYSEAFATLSPYERPKKIYTISRFPYTETGKIKRGDVFRLLKGYR